MFLHVKTAHCQAYFSIISSYQPFFYPSQTPLLHTKEPSQFTTWRQKTTRGTSDELILQSFQRAQTYLECNRWVKPHHRRQQAEWDGYEDVAYVYFKRYELKDQWEVAKKNGTISTLLFIPTFLFQRIVFDWIGLYATNPFRVLFSIVIVNFLFSLIYTFFYSTSNYLTCMDPSVSLFDKFSGNLYFSAITFFTVGYGDCSPIGFFKLLSPVEGFIGVFLMSYFTVAFVRKILR